LLYTWFGLSVLALGAVYSFTRSLILNQVPLETSAELAMAVGVFLTGGLYAGLLTLIVKIGQGRNWARIALEVLVGLFLAGQVVVMFRDPLGFARLPWHVLLPNYMAVVTCILLCHGGAKQFFRPLAGGPQVQATPAPARAEQRSAVRAEARVGKNGTGRSIP
jgi:hypothetical protein